MYVQQGASVYRISLARSRHPRTLVTDLTRQAARGGRLRQQACVAHITATIYAYAIAPIFEPVECRQGGGDLCCQALGRRSHGLTTLLTLGAILGVSHFSQRERLPGGFCASLHKLCPRGSQSSAQQLPHSRGLSDSNRVLLLARDISHGNTYCCHWCIENVPLEGAFPSVLLRLLDRLSGAVRWVSQRELIDNHPMRAWVLHKARTPLFLEDRPVPAPGRGQVRLRVMACGVCRTDLHLLEGELADAALPVVPGHEVVGIVDAVGPGVSLALGERVGVPWLGYTCGSCTYCRAGLENLCDHGRFTGCHIDGGYADWMLADERYCLQLPAGLDDLHAAPLLCAGLIGYRCLDKAGEAERLGLYGFGAAAHLITQIARHQGRQIYAFVRPGDRAAAAFALDIGASWAGDSDAAPPLPLDAAIIFAPVGNLVPQALRTVRKAGHVICGGIHMSPIPQFPYEWLWGERRISSVANLTRADGQKFMGLAARLPLKVHAWPYELSAARLALDDLRSGSISGAAVLIP